MKRVIRNLIDIALFPIIGIGIILGLLAVFLISIYNKLRQTLLNIGV